jgi:uncharacterized membrane protein YedE/YeeE
MSAKRISMAALVSALTAGLVFALGLVISGMSQPGVVLGFLDVTALAKGVKPWVADGWDPSLALVMAGALMVTVAGFQLTPKSQLKPWHADKFELPSRKDIDAPLVLGAVMFGAGWGLAGYCPGPALASVIYGGLDALVFTICMLAGMVLARWVQRPKQG